MLTIDLQMMLLLWPDDDGCCGQVTADAAGAKQEGEPVYAQLTQQFRTAAARMQEVGLHSFAGDTDGR